VGLELLSHIREVPFLNLDPEETGSRE
jgi:hypothetical protein